MKARIAKEATASNVTTFPNTGRILILELVPAAGDDDNMGRPSRKTTTARRPIVANHTRARLKLSIKLAPTAATRGRKDIVKASWR